jgi:hypothetical protein
MVLSSRALFFSHGVVFIGGFALGKMINQDELEAYRSIHESSITKFRRNATTVAFGVLAIGTLYVVIRATSRKETVE